MKTQSNVINKLLNAMVLWIWRLVGVLIILMGLFIVLGKQLTPLVGNYKPQIEQYLTKRLGAAVSIEHLSAQWIRFGPKIEVQKISIGNDISTGFIAFEPAWIESLMKGELIFSQLQLDKFDLSLTQTEAGFFVSGVRLPDQQEGTPLSLKDFIAQLQKQQRIQFNDIHLNLNLLNRPKLELQISTADLSSFLDKSWLIAQADLLTADEKTAVEIQIETQGYDDEQKLNLYVDHEEFDLTPWLAPLLPAPLHLSSFKGTGEYWGRWDGTKLQHFSSRVNLAQLNIANGEHGESFFTNLSTKMIVNQSPEGYVGWLDDLTFSIEDNLWEKSKHQFEWVDSQLRFLSSNLDVGMLSRLASPFDEQNTLAGLSPKGQLINPDIRLNFGERLTIAMQSKIEGLWLEPYKGVPGMGPLNGYIDATDEKGRFTILPQPASMHVANLYEKDWQFTELSGDLYWHFHQNFGLFLKSDNLKAKHENVGLLTGHFYLSSPFAYMMDEFKHEPFLSMQLNFNDIETKNVEPFFPNLGEIDLTSRQWLLSNINTGKINKGSVIFNAALKGEAKNNNSFLIAGDVSDVDITFAADWPEAIGLTGNVGFTNNVVFANVSSGNYLNAQVSDATLLYEVDDTPSVSMNGNVSGQISTIMSMMTSTPLREYIGNSADDWQASGKVAGNVTLDVPLYDAPTTFDIAVKFDNGFLLMPEYELAIEKAHGDLNFSDKKGLWSDNLNGQFFGFPTTATLTSSYNQNDVMLMDFRVKGRAGAKDVAKWLDEPLLGEFSGNTLLDAQLKINEDTVEINLHSDLLGIDTATLPAPVGKTPEQVKPLEVNIVVYDDHKDIELFYDNWLQGHLIMQGNDFTSGVINNRGSLDIIEESGIYIDIELDETDGDYWTNYILLAKDLSPDGDPADPTPSFDERIRQIKIKANSVVFGGFDFTDVDAAFIQNREGWVVDYQSSESSGSVGIPNPDDLPIVASIEFLTLTMEDEEADKEKDGKEKADNEPKVDVLAQSVNPLQIPLVQVAINRLKIDEHDLGNWQFSVSPVEKGIDIHDINGSSNGVFFAGGLSWFVEKDQHFSSLKLNVVSDQTTAALKAFDIPPAIKAGRSQFDLALNWKGSPYVFDFDKVNGKIDLDVRDGFITALNDYEGVKLVGLLNFSRLVKRLTLDFSDIVGEGVPFDVMRSEIEFNQGVAHLYRPFTLDGSSLKFSIDGNIDLEKETLDMEGRITVPITSAVPMFSVLAGVSPQAVAFIFITEKMVNNQLEKLTSWKISLDGTLDNPDYEFKYFD